MTKLLKLDASLLLLFGIRLSNCDAQVCRMCPDGTNNFASGNRIIPFFSLPGGNTNPTCQQLADTVEETEARGVDCSLVQAQAGFCGCSGVPSLEKCTFCSDGSLPANMDLETPTGDTCRDLNDYFQFFAEDECEGRRAKSIQGFASLCGCPNAEPECYVCPDRSNPPLTDQQALPSGETCQEMTDIISAYQSDVCIDDETTISIVAARCGCPGSSVPVCQVQENTQLCTEELLDTVPEECECYSFCDGEFLNCLDFPGAVVDRQLCSGTIVGGCNRALLENQSKNAASASRMKTWYDVTFMFFVTYLTALMY